MTAPAALSHGRMPQLTAALRGIGGAAAQSGALAELVACLNEPAALAVSFRHGETGSPDFFGLSSLVASVMQVQDQLQVMEALSFCLRKSQPCVLEKAQTLTTHRVEAGSKLYTGFFGTGGISAIRHAWYGPRGDADGEKPEGGVDVTEKVIELLGANGIEGLDPSDAFGEIVAGDDHVLIVDVATQTEDSAVVRVANDAMVVDEESTPTEPHPSWLAVALAAALPLLEGSLPRDEHGVCMLPHPHPMKMMEADKTGCYRDVRGGRHIWLTNKICDRCTDHIADRVFYHCSEGCDVDFCSRCQEDLQGVLNNFFQGVLNDSCHGSDVGQVKEHKQKKMMWVCHLIDEFAFQIMNRNQDERMLLAQLLASEWPPELFQSLVGVVVDACNAKLLYNCTLGALATCVSRTGELGGESHYNMQALPLYQDDSYPFWFTIALLQFLYECSGLMQQEEMLDGHEARGHKIPIERFILEGINKCNPSVEWEQWERTSGTVLGIDVLRTPRFQCSTTFRSLVVHNNLLPISFRRQCLVADINNQINAMARDRGHVFNPWLVLEVDREPDSMIESICRVFARTAPQPAEQQDVDGTSEVQGPTQHLLRLLRVTFKGEEYETGIAAQGPGVRREFFQVALRAFVSTLFIPASNRSFWFNDVQKPEAFFACGVLLGQVLLHAELIPNVFPWPLYDLLLRDLGSPKASSTFTIQHLAEVSPAEATSIGKVLEYEGDDITQVFGDVGWERVPNLVGKTLTQETKAHFVDAYIQWSFGEKIEDRYRHLSDGFKAVIGSSFMVQKMLDAKQLAHIVCGSDAPVDISAIRRYAVAQHWHGCDDEYIDAFWSVLANLPEAAKVQFVRFVTGSDRMPLQGWEELRVKVQKNGIGDERLPVAYTCFSLILLPKYSSVDILRARLLSSIKDSQGFGLQ